MEGADWTRFKVSPLCVCLSLCMCVCVMSVWGERACWVFNRQFLLGGTAGHLTLLYRLFAITEPVVWLLCQLEYFSGSNNEGSLSGCSNKPSHPSLASRIMIFLSFRAYCGLSYICCWSFLILGHTALQIECEVIAVHQNTLAKLLLKLLHVWLYSWEIEFLKTVQWKVLHFIREC